MPKAWSPAWKSDAVRVVGTVNVVQTGRGDAGPEIVGEDRLLERYEGEPAISAREVTVVER